VKLLAVDAGNTRIKWGLHDGRAWSALGSVDRPGRGGLQASWEGISTPQLIIVSNVAGQETGEFLEEGFRRWDAPRRWISSRAEQGGVRNGYANPAQLGCDRWAALIAARSIGGGAACLVVSAGTAVTVDALGRDGRFLGGLIIPGANLMKSALAASTAGLGVEPGLFQPFPTSTANAIESGACQALAGAVDRMGELLAHRDGAEPRCFLGGGDAARLRPHLRLPAQVVDNLVLEGLVIIARERGPQ
jgi:type III pantothenate kinase